MLIGQDLQYSHKSKGDQGSPDSGAGSPLKGRLVLLRSGESALVSLGVGWGQPAPPEVRAQRFSFTFKSLPAGALRSHICGGPRSLLDLGKSPVERWRSSEIHLGLRRPGKRASFLKRARRDGR